MKRASTIFLVLFFAQFLNAQERLRFGLEFNANTAPVNSYYKPGVSGLNVFFLYKRYELYVGFDINLQEKIKLNMTYTLSICSREASVIHFEPDLSKQKSPPLSGD